MTYGEKVAWLGRYNEKDREINRILIERSEWEAKATDISPKYSDMPKAAPTESKIPSAVEKMIECESKADAEIDELEKIGQEIESAISGLTDSDFRNVLTRKYLCAMNFAAISKILNCSRHKIYDIHEKAINEIIIVS